MYLTVVLRETNGNQITIVPKYIESLEATGKDRVRVCMASGKVYVIQNTLEFLTSIITEK